MKITAAALIARQKVVIRADAERMARRPKDYPRGAWRERNPIGSASVEVKDTAMKTRPIRILAFDLNGSSTDLWVWSVGRRAKVIDRVNLGAAGADECLARYVSQRTDPC